MGLLFDNTFVEVTCILLSLMWIFYLNVTWLYTYWKHKAVPHVKPTFPFGCMSDFVWGKRHRGDFYQQFYEQFKSEPYFGIYEIKKPVLIVKDPKLIKLILTKDFQHFMNRFELTINKKMDYIGNHLFNMTGHEWKQMRTKLAPTFTSAKMKLMFFHMLKCSEQVREYLAKQLKTNPIRKTTSIIDVKDVSVRFTMDIIATCAFGLETNCLTEEECEFHKFASNMFKPRWSTNLRRVLSQLLPFLKKTILLRNISENTSNFFTKIVRETVDYRENNNVSRNDFLDLLIRIRQRKSLADDAETSKNTVIENKRNEGENDLSIEEIIAQSFIFWVAGFETASSTMAFCLYELSQNPLVQDRLFQEVKDILETHNGQMDYQALQEMTYMDQVISETLRLYASLSSLDRTCTVPYKIPDSDLVLEKGIRITIPIYAIHHDSEFYPDPNKFDPERFSKEMIKGRDPYVHLPFGDGPRMCIGMRFGIMQMKIGLAEMLSKYRFSLSPFTEIPVSLNKISFLTQPENPILLQIQERNTAI